VFVFRLATFWLPILPGWLAFTWLQRSDRICAGPCGGQQRLGPGKAVSGEPLTSP
jgi:hypothetical protein